MQKILFTLLTSLFLLVLGVRTTFAFYNPSRVDNNRFGIHIYDENDLEDAARLVNSSGGDWGYVTFVITEEERNFSRWQEAFNRMRRLHLIPIVRIATKSQEGIWEKPSETEINNWIAFLNSLNWVIENRYVVIGNEPNHAKEWGGELDPQGYASYIKNFSQKLKQANENFFVLPAGLDASAPNSSDTMEESAFLREMLIKEPDLFNYLDGWNSHSYPNPAFSGSERASGKGTIRTFDWEIGILNGLGVTKELPIFITETGWVNSLVGVESRFSYAFQNVWSDERVIAVTPFILNYTTPPFDIFSWKNKEGNFTPTYETVKALPKEKGTPRQLIKGDIIFSFLEPIGISGNSIKGIIYARNTGQNIWDDTNVNVVQVSGENLRIVNIQIPTIEPSKLGFLLYDAQIPESEGTSEIVIQLKVDNQDIGEAYRVEVTSVAAEENKWGLFWEKVIIRVQSFFLSVKQFIGI